jgi:hypothetical protein
MNLFYLDPDPKACAAAHCDKHVVKMIIETAQLLSTAVRVHKPNAENVYKTSHLNHPSAIWVRANRSNYLWALTLLHYLGLEYSMRYGKQHKTIREVMPALHKNADLFPEGKFFAPPQVVPEQHKQEDTVAAYRAYYHDKLHFIAYRNLGWPAWLARPPQEI